MGHIFETPIRLLVAHQNPDLDAIAACWLFMRYGGEDFEGAELYFVPAGEEISDEVLTNKDLSREEVVHVDTGLGRFDHHQPDNQKRDSATLRVFDYLKSKLPQLKEEKALSRMVTFLNDIDHFASCYWPEALHDRYGFMLEEVLKGVRQDRHFSDRELAEFGMICLDGVLASMKMKVSAEAELSDGQLFTTQWGKALAIENRNDEVVKVAQKSGYQLVVRKDKESGHVRIKGVPDKGIDLTKLQDLILEKDKVGTWYLHPSKAMLLNGSSRNLKQVATPLSLDEIVSLIKQIS